MERNKIIKKVKEIIHQYLGDEVKIVLYGSWAKGNAVEMSDLDIGILVEGKVETEIIGKIKEEIEEIPTLRKIDIVDLNNTDEKFKNNVLGYAKVL